MAASQPLALPPDDAVSASAIDARYAEACRALDRAGVAWVRLRPRGDGHEEDLLVEAGAWARIGQALAAVGYAPVRRLARGSHREFHGFEPGPGRWLKLDLVTRLDFGRYQEHPTDLAAAFLARRRPSHDGWALHPDDAFWAVALHELLDRGAGRPIRRLEELAALATGAGTEGPGARAARALGGGHAAQAILRAARTGEVRALAEAGQRIERWRRHPIVVLRRFVASALRRLDHLDPPLVRRGLTVALLGPDGAGKSTISRVLAAGGPLPTRTVYLGLYGGSRGGRGRRRLPGLGLAGRLVRMWRGWLVGRLHVSRGRIVVFDRHPLDARLGHAGSGRRRLIRGLLGRSVPTPEVTIVLDAPASLLYARKPEHDVERLDRQRADYLDLARRLGAPVVDVSGTREEVAAAVTGLAWEAYAGRTGRQSAGRPVAANER